MKTLRRIFLSIVAAAMMFASTRTVISGPNNDADAGTWQMVVLTSPTQFAVPAPLSTTSSNYQSELPTIRSAQSQMTRRAAQVDRLLEQGRRVRWNEIMIEFVARADLPPAPRADGTYPGSRREQPVCRSELSVRQPAVRRAGVQLRERRAIRGAEGGVVLQVPLQPPLAVEGRQFHSGADSEQRPAGLSVGGRGAVGRQRRAAEAALPEWLRARSTRSPTSSCRWRMLSGKARPATRGRSCARSGRSHRSSSRVRERDGMGTAGGTPAILASLTDAATRRAETCRGSSLEIPAASADAAAVRQGEDLDDDAGRHRQGAARAAPVDVVTADAARAGRGEGHRDAPDARAVAHRDQVGRRREHGDAARPLELHREAVHRRCEVQRGARRADLRPPRTCRCTTPRSAAGTRSSSTSTRVRRSSIPRSRRRSACRTSRRTPRGIRRSPARPPKCCRYLFPTARARFETRPGRGRNLASLRRHSLPDRHRSREGPRQANRRLYREICDARRRRPLNSLHCASRGPTHEAQCAVRHLPARCRHGSRSNSRRRPAGVRRALRRLPRQRRQRRRARPGIATRVPSRTDQDLTTRRPAGAARRRACRRSPT